MHALVDYLVAEARSRPQAPFLIAPASAGLPFAPDGYRITYGQMLDEVQALTSRLAAAGVGPGQRVALLMGNRPEFIRYWLAINAVGASIVPLNADLTPVEMTAQLEIAEAVMLVHTDEHADKARALRLPGCAVVAEGDPLPAVAGGARRSNAPPEPAARECALLFTSGSTGTPKGCVLSNHYFATLAQWYVTQGGVAEMERHAEVALTPLPLFHMNALGCTVLGMLAIGGTVVLLDRFHASTWWQTVVDSEATIAHCLGVIPAILLQLPASPADRAHRLKFILGPGVDARHKVEFEARFDVPIVEAWAMTETGGRAVTTTARDTEIAGERCIGRPREGMAHRLVDDCGDDVAPGRPGELIVRAEGPDPRDGFFSGYLKDTATTEAAWLGGWFRTGDLVYEGEGGLLYFFDRKKTVVRRSGENIGVLEVEAVLLRDERIVSVAVAPAPDPIRGEEVCALIVLRAPPVEPGALAESVVRRAAGELAYHKLPGHIALVETLPVSSTQKLQRSAIKALAADLVAAGKTIDLRGLKGRLRRERAG